MIRILMEPGRIEITGHAFFAEPGEDIVCAGISAIMQAAVNGVRDIARKYPEHVSVELIDRRDHADGIPPPPTADSMWRQP